MSKCSNFYSVQCTVVMPELLPIDFGSQYFISKMYSYNRQYNILISIYWLNHYQLIIISQNLNISPSLIRTYKNIKVYGSHLTVSLSSTNSLSFTRSVLLMMVRSASAICLKTESRVQYNSHSPDKCFPSSLNVYATKADDTSEGRIWIIRHKKQIPSMCIFSCCAQVCVIIVVQYINRTIQYENNSSHSLSLLSLSLLLSVQCPTLPL